MDNKYNTYKLDNGLKLLLIPMKNIELVYLQLAVLVGADNESVENKNIESSHFLEHLFALYTSNKYPSVKNNRDFFKVNGISSNASVNSNTTKFDLRYHKKNNSRVLDIVYNAYKDFKIDKKIYEQERVSIEEEIKNILDDIWNPLQEKIDKALYLDHIRSNSQRVNLKSVKSIKPSKILEFYKKFYKPSNTTLIIAGDFPPNTLSLCKKTFGTIKDSNCIPLTYGLSNINLHPQIVFSRITSSLSYNLYIIFRIPILYFSDDYYTNSTMSSILASDTESILMNVLRTKHGLIYSIDYEVSLDEKHKTLSYISINTQIDEKNLLKTISLILKVLHDLKSKEIEDKAYLKYGKDLQISILEDKINRDPEEFINLYGRNLMWNKNIESSKSVYKKLKSVSKKDIKEMAKKIYKKENMLICYGGKKSYDKRISKIINSN